MNTSSCRFSHHFAANLYRAFKPNTVLASVASVALVALTACGGSAAVPASVAQAFAPVITSPAPQMLVAGQTVNLAVVFGNTGGPPTSCRVDTSDDKPSLPAGLVLATALAAGTLTCQITGTPTGPTDGSVDVTIVATNALGSSSAIVRITIAPTTTTTDPAPAMTDAQARILIAGELASPAIVFTNTGGDAASCAVDTSSGKPDLPASLSVATATVAGKVTCQITGTPAAATDAATYSVTATNAAGSSTASVMITVNSPAPVFAAPALADAAARTLLAGEEVSPAIVFSNIGADADTCHVDTTSADKPDLPAGLTIGTVTDAVSGKVSCQITGTPISATAGAVTVSIVAANSAEESSSASVDITVSQAPSLVRAGAQTFIVDQLVSPAIPLTNTGGDADTCVIDTGASQSTPPPGISAQIVTVNGKATCEITGTPTEASAGAVVVTVIAENELGSSTATMAITVIDRPEEAVDAPVLADAMDSTLIAGVPVSPAIDFTNTGGDVNTCRVDISENKPDLPAGLTVGTATDAVSGKVSCQITGTPFDATTGTVVVSIVAANTAETTASATVSFTVNAPPALVKAGAQTLVSDRVVSPAIVFTNTGGDATTCRVDTSENKPDLPTGLSTTTVTVRGKATCQITGTPTGSSDGAVTITIMAENEQGSAVALIDLTVIAPPPIVVAPALQAATAVTLVSGQTFTPAIVFANTGGDVTTCLVDTSDDKPDLPASLLLTAATDAASGKITCQITGTPDAAAAGADYTITAVNTAGLSTAQVMITIIDAAIATVAPALTDITAPVILVVGEEISAAIIYTNTADDAASCSVDTSEGKPDLPMGLSATSVSDTASGKVTCQITGTPATATATATYSVTATNAVGTATATVMITVNDPAPVVIAPALTDATAVTLLTGQAFTPAIVFANTGGDVTSCAVDTANSQPDLPASLSLATATDASTGKVTCQITGTPDAATATAAYTITATNTAGTSTAAVMITVIDAPTPTIAPMLANAPARTLVVGELLSPAIVFSNTGDNATTCTIDTSGGNPDLPASLSVSSVTDTSTGKVTCQITGTPDATTTATYTVTATNSIGSFSATVIITVNDPPAIIAPVLEDIATPITVITGTGISSTIVFANTGGDATSCTVDTSGSNADLPSGLSVATVTVAGKVTCQITGTPDTATTTALYTITATNTAGASSATVMITINDPAAVVLAPALANIAAPVTTFTGTAISPAIIYTNTGDDVTSCTVDTSGSNADLPTGLSVAVVIVNGKATCQITGTPDTAATTTVYTITATNTAGASSATVTITINDPPPVDTAPALANIATPVTTLTGTAISPAIIYTNTGGNATTCTVDTSGSNADLPTGLSVATVTVNGKVTCQITGTPDTAATTTVYTITATNSIDSSSATVTITVVSAPELANIATPVTAIAGNALNPAIVFTNTGGDAATCSVTDSNPSLPAGLMITTATDAGIVTCQITGTPNTATATSTYTITATNSGGPSSATVTITVVTTPALANIAAPVTAVAGTALSPAIVFANTGSDADSCAIDTSGANPDLPAGLMITTTTTSGKVTCQISGTPTVILTATPTTTATYTITATNIAGSSSATVMITVIRAPALTNIATPVTAITGTALSPAIVFTNTGGDATNCQVNTSSGKPNLPASLSVATTTDVISGAVTCQISGTPDAATADTYTITASNVAGASSASVMITVNEPGPDEPNLSIPAPDMVVEAFPHVPFVLNLINSGGDVEMDGCVLSADTGLFKPTWMSAERYQQGDGTYSCRLTGTPGTSLTSTGTDVVIEATNSGGQSTTRFMMTVVFEARIADRTGAGAIAFSRNVEQVVMLVNSGASVEVANSCMIDAAGDALPTGLSLRIVVQENGRHTCAIGGLAMSVTALPLNVRIKATSLSGIVSTSNVELIVVAREPVLSDVSSITIVPGINVSDIDFANIGGDVQASDGCILAQGSPMLPAGLALARYRQADGVYSCQITGATTQNTASTTALTVAGVNSFGASEAGISITIEPGEIATTAPILADIAQVQTFNIGTLMRVLFPNTGGNVAIGGCAISSGSLPSGLSVGLFRSGNTVTCGIFGTPLVLTATSQLITVAAMNAASNGAVSSATVSIDVDVAIIDIDAPVISNLAAQTIIAGAIIKPIIFTNTGDSVDENAGGCTLDTNSVALPLGLSLARVMHLGVATCQIIGLAQSANASPVTVFVNARNAGGLGSASVAITVSPAIVLNPPQLASLSAGPFTANQDIRRVFFPNTGGDVSVDGCRLTAGSPLLPAGLMLVRAGLDGRQTCAISGAPTQIMPAGRTSSITATGADGTAIAEVTIVVVDQTPLLANIADAQSLTIGVPVADAIVFPNTGGDVQVDGCAVDSSAGKPMLPMGLSAIAVTVAGKVTCQITGTPGELSDEAVYTITAINSGNPGLAASATVTITVVAPRPNLSNISGEHILNAGSAIIPLRFVNTGGSVSGENACTVTSLPAGLELRTYEQRDTLISSCEIFGTPTTSAGRNNYSITATNASGSSLASTLITVLTTPVVGPVLSGPSDMIALVQGSQQNLPIVITNSGGAIPENGCTASSGSVGGNAGTFIYLSAINLELSTTDAGCEIRSISPAGPTTEVAAVAYTIDASNRGGSSDSVTFMLSITAAAPVLANVDGVKQLTIGTQITPIDFANSGGGVVDHDDQACELDPSSAALPAGLRLVSYESSSSGNSCRIVGTPLASAIGAVTVSVIGSNPTGQSTATVSMTVVSNAINLVSFDDTVVLVKDSQAAPIVFSNLGIGADNCRLFQGSVLPNGLRLSIAPAAGGSAASCQITGTPTTLSPLAVSVAVAATATTVADSIATVSIGVVEEIPAAFIAVAAGARSTCATDSSGRILCWGANEQNGHLGALSTAGDVNYPALLDSSRQWLDLSVAERHACAVSNDHQLHCWGANNFGQLGSSNLIPTTTPVRVGAFQDWSQVSSGTNYTCATRAGQLYCWGDNRAGQLGTGALRGGATFTDEPQRVGSKLDWRHVVAGRTHTCAVDYRGGLYCWGESGDWLGLGPQESNRLSPGQVSGMWRSVSVGDRHTCAVALSGSLHCWGLNGAGQLGIAEPGDSAPRPGRDVPARVGTDNDWRFVEAGGAHTCAVKSTGALYCWGQLSDTTSASAAQVINIFPTQIGSASDWARLSSGLDHACALNNAGRLYCWGSGEHGRTGLLRSSYAATPTAVIRAPVAPTTAPSLSAPTAQLTLNIGDRIADIEFVNAAGPLALNSCAAGNLPAGLRLETYFQSSGVRSCRISGRAVSLVNPPATISVSAVNAAGAGPANIIIGTATRVPVLSGPDELVIYKVGDNVHLVFENTGGSPSGSSNPCRFTAETVDSGIVTRGLDVVPQASSDGSITCALVGQPQIATEEPIDVTVTALTLRNPDIAATEDNILRSDPITFQMRLDPLLPPVYTAVSVSRDHSCAIDNASRMWCWGINVSQKIGINNIGINRPSTIPALITGGKRDWTQVSAAERHTCALDATGKLFCWGSGDSVGNTSIAPLGSTPTPTRVGSQSNWVSVSAAASGRHTCAVNDDGGLYCWGDNLLGQSGAATSTQRVATPRQVGGNVWSSVSAGQAHTCAIRTNNTLYCWGENYTSTPAQVGTASNWVSVDAGEVHTCAIDSTSALYCWGEAGAWLGLGSVTTRQTMPALVGASSDLASGWATVRAGFRFSCAVTTAGKLYCWGKAGAHLGQGSISADVSTPMQVGTQSNWVQLDSGGGRNYENLNNDRSGHSCAINNAGQLRCWGNDTQGQLGLTGAGDSDRPAAVNDGLADVTSAPALQSIVGTRTAVAGEFLSPLILRNTGGSVRLGGCSASGNLPTGLTVSTVFVSDHLTCQISGVAAEVMAPVTVSITGTGDAGSAQATVTIAVVQPPVQLVSLTGQANLIEGTPITAIQMTNSGGDAISCANTEADDSPSTALTDLGLTIGLFDDGEGVGCQITGTPTGFTGSRITYGLTATDANGFTSRATVTFRVQPRAPVLSSTAVRFSMIEGVPVSETGVIIFNNTGGDVEPGGCTIGATSAELPSGLSLATVALTSGVVGCQIFGTPTRGYTGDRAIVVDAVNVSNRASASSVTINLAVVGAPQIRSGFFRVPSGEFFPQNVFTYRVQPYHSSPPGREIRFENSGGTLRSCTVTPSLPTGLSLRANSCSIVGSASHRLFERDSTHIVTAVGLTPALTSSATITIRIRAHAPPNIRDRSVHRDFDLALVGTDFIRFVNDGGTVAENGCAVESSGPSLSSLRMELGVHEGSCVVFTNNNSNFNGGALVNGPVRFTIRARNSLGTTASSFVVAGYSTTDRLGIPSQFRGRFSFDPFRNARFTYSLGTTPTFTINQPAMVTFNHIFSLEYADANVNLNEAGAGKQINFIDCRLRNYSTIPEGVLVNPQDCSLFGTPIAAPRVSNAAAVIFEVDTLCCEQPSLSGLPISFSPGGQPSLAASATLNLRQRSGVGLPYLIANSGRAPTSCTAVPSGANTRSLDDLNLRISPYRASCVIDSLDGSGPSAIAVGATYTINGSTGLTINVSAHTPGFSQISAGGWHTCAIAKSGRLLCWGDNSSGAVGLAGSNQRLVPEPVGTATDWASVSAGFQHTCAIKNSGALWCWGKNGNGQLGVAGAGSRFGPTRVGTRTDWAKVSAGYEHTCALTNASSIYCWGRADLGSIGVGDLMDKFNPILVSTLSNWTDISAGNGHTCAVNSSGRAWCWGFNGSGQLGIASTTNRTRPTEIVLHSSLRVISVSAGSDHTCAVVSSNDGVIQTFCWGGNGGGQLGSGTLGDVLRPQFVSVLIDPMRPATSRSPMQLAAGGLHSCVLTTLKEVLCWGQGGHFQLGSRFSSFRPFHLDFLSNISSISTGDTHTCAVSSSGDGWCWGNAMHGRIGNGRAAGRALPTRLSSPFVD